MLERVCVCVQDPLTMNTNTQCSLLAYKPIDGTIEEIAKDYRYTGTHKDTDTETGGTG